MYEDPSVESMAMLDDEPDEEEDLESERCLVEEDMVVNVEPKVDRARRDGDKDAMVVDKRQVDDDGARKEEEEEKEKETAATSDDEAGAAHERAARSR